MFHTSGTLEIKRFFRSLFYIQWNVNSVSGGKTKLCCDRKATHFFTSTLMLTVLNPVLIFFIDSDENSRKINFLSYFGPTWNSKCFSCPYGNSDLLGASNAWIVSSEWKTVFIATLFPFYSSFVAGQIEWSWEINWKSCEINLIFFFFFENYTLKAIYQERGCERGNQKADTRFSRTGWIRR